MLARSILCLGLTVALLLLSQPLLAQTSLPACTAEIADLDGDGTNDNDGADGIIDIDKDGDGLIEICDLEGLNEIRYQLNGSGYKASADATIITQGCPRSGCRGYELVKDLDFKTDASYRTTSNKVTWTTGRGWVPIGSDSNRLSSVFEGNGHTIAHLYIRRSNEAYVGLFAITAETALINNIKLSDVDIHGNNRVSSLVGNNHGSIISIDVTGSVKGIADTGGLVGENNGQITMCVANAMIAKSSGLGFIEKTGGLVGLNSSGGLISESSASGNVIGNFSVGGLVGWNTGSIANTYAEGNVSGNGQIGGLVGGRSSRSSITNSYAIGQPRGSHDIGGLVGFNLSGSVTASYWDTVASMQASRGDFEAAFAKTKAELQSPTAPGTTPTEIYYGWSTDIWDFGSASTYPLLRSAGIFAVDGLEVVIDVDKDNDGLIEIYDIEGLNEMRYQLDGSGHKTSASGTKITQGCPETGCIGYELMKDLDFNADASYYTTSNKVTWTTASGWSPIGSDSNRFSGVFEGNGHTIANLYIDRTSNDIGLFAVTAETAQIQNIKLLNATIQGAIDVGSLVGSNFGLIINSDVTTATIVGNSQIGGLVGRNMGLIINSYAMSATVEGHSDIGGLVGANRADILSSFAYTDVIGFSNVGGLVGDNTSNIINTYAAGTVSSTQTVSHAGGLVGANGSSGSIRNSYAVSQVMPLTDENSQVGGLVGDDNGSITASYWDTTVNAHLMTSDGDGAKTAAELKTPTAPGATSADTYYGWRTTAWDFDDSIHYPTLYYATTDSITVSACTDNTIPSSALPRCGSRIPHQAVRNLTPDFEVSEITISSQPVANADGTINEGSNVRLMVNATGGSENYNFVWSQTSGKALSLTTTDTATLNVAIASDFVEQDATTAAITFQVDVNDGISTISHSAIITIKKINNGIPAIAVDVNAARLRVITTGSDADGVGSFSYQWQQLVSGGWMDIPAATTATYWLPADADDRIQYRVEVKHTDGQGYTTDYPIQGPFRARLDDDNDGLIDIYTLEDLDAIRNQYLNIPDRCGSTGDIVCNGFELRRSLDFNAAESYQSGLTDPNWTTSTGWTPIGSVDESFNRVFEGNGFTISGLYINRNQSNIGLFGVLSSEIKNIGLLDVNIQGGLGTGGLVGWNRDLTNIINSYASGAVSGSSYVGGLIGRNTGRAIINSYATGAVTATGFYIGGLVGWNESGAHIINSYASGAVSGNSTVGGLVGWHHGHLRNTYATGDVSLTGASDDELGGLVGEWSRTGSIRNSYAIGQVIPSANNARNAGGLIGNTTGTVVSSYWDGEASDWNISAGGGVTSRTTMELQSPIAPGVTTMDVYYGWRDNNWDFGDDEDYPALRYIAGGMNACTTDILTASDLPQCGSLLPNQGRTAVFAVSEVTISSQPVVNNDGTINEGSNVSLRVNVIGGSGEYNFAWSQTSGQAVVLTTTDTAILNVAIAPDLIAEDLITTTLTFTVMVDDGMSSISRSRMITITKASLAISGVMLSATTIAEGSTATVTFNVSSGTGIYQYAYKLIADEDEITLPSLAPPAVLVMPIDIVAAADSERAVELNIIVSDGSGRNVEHDAALTIEKVDNGSANIEASRVTSRTVTVKVGGDPDGDADDPNYAYQWQWRAAEATAQWVTIAGEEDASYTIIDDLAVINNEFRVQVMYTDGQGYQATLISNAVRYDFLPPCTMAIADSDGDGVGATIDIDKDGDGLIELCDLEGLNEMRYQLDGNGYKTSEGATSSRRGCPLVDGEEHCRGYELMQSLDFNEVASYRENTLSSAWTAGSGWLPIDAGFASVFEGNSHSIVNLSINRTEAASGSEQGLFSTLATTAQINNIQLLDVNIKGFAQVAALSGSNSGIIRNSSASGEVMANSDVGGLVGRNDGSVVSSDADVAVTANMNGGGLVGHNQGSLSDSQAFGEVMGGSRLGGLSGVNDGLIISSYATATVNGTDTSSDDMGGLVGHNNNVIANSYATGAVSATGNNIGGLVGFNNNGRIVNTYAEGSVMGASQVGGLIGRHHGSLRDSYAALGAVSGSGSDIGGLIGIINTTATVIASYWDSEESGQASSASGESKTTAELQTATAPGTTTTAVYYNWSDNDWDFGDSSHYPALRYASDDDLNSCTIDITTSTMALPCVLLSGQSDRDKGLATIFFFSDDSSATVTTEPLFSPLTNSYMVTIVTRAERVRLTLRPYAINADATITVTDPTDTSYFAAKLNGALSDEIPLVAETTVTIVVSDILGEDTVHTTYTFAITSELPPLMVSDIKLSVQPPANTDNTINEGSTATLTFNVSGGTGVYQYEFKIDDDVSTSSTPLFIYSIADDFIAADATSQTVRVTIRVSDQSDEIEDFEHTEVLHILKTNNGSADINLSITNMTLTAIVGADPDGNPNPASYTYQWQTKTGADWMDITSTTDTSYTISDEVKTSAEFRVQVMYIDGQGYEEMLTSNEIPYTPPNELPPLTVSDIQLSVQPPANVDGTINEGSTATLTFEVSGGTDMYQYEFTIDDDVSTSSTPLFIYSIADDFIASDATSQTVTLTIRVSDQSAEIEDLEYTEELHIQGTNNGSADIDLSITSATLTATVGTDPDGDPNPPNYTYQWQAKTGSEWMDITSTTDTSYTISGDLASASGEFRVQVMYIDGQGYPETPISNAIRYTSPSELQPLTVSDIQLSVQPPANANGTINEGSTATLTFEVSGGTGVYQYEFTIDDDVSTSSTPLFIYSIADDFIASDATSQTVRLTIRVSDQSAEIEDVEHTEELHIRGINNGPADINISITNTTLTATIGTDPDGDPNPDSYTYQWQAKTGSEWMDIASTTDTSYTISGDLASASGEFRVQVMYTDGQGYEEIPISNAIRYTPPDSSGLRIRTKVFLEGPLR